MPPVGQVQKRKGHIPVEISTKQRDRIFIVRHHNKREGRKQKNSHKIYVNR
ncbi:uncharacterized protein NEPG_02207 [Nematocida parisii ERTm1]|uniref:Uncharacterized protein n=1 Tax=Nematocida parisii (strain ERTm3) TaxID=935791 RepID=I3EED4_NEMP3|nr:uncharacterized protein NEPG_02207 [Nematocida parisii ERTm1]EIJ87581.1 hypothetical protein NEQG_02128 [Nematocida parisii ERTm3]EIJ92808.1 hypothetical protein NEPG_02207 [Nematocida parisii ERTm1]|eukprot:XP_013060034.1 hypothetical protein NEPG_02207 [Nematocida parisii ERTm1]